MLNLKACLYTYDSAHKTGLNMWAIVFNLRSYCSWRERAIPFGQWAVRTLLVACDRNLTNWIVLTLCTGRFRGLNNVMRTEIYPLNFQSQLFTKLALFSDIWISYARSNCQIPAQPAFTCPFEGLMERELLLFPSIPIRKKSWA